MTAILPERADLATTARRAPEPTASREAAGLVVERFTGLPPRGALRTVPVDAFSVLMIEQQHCLVSRDRTARRGGIALHGSASLGATVPGEQADLRWSSADGRPLSSVHVRIPVDLVRRAARSVALHVPLDRLGGLEHRSPAAVRTVSALSGWLDEGLPGEVGLRAAQQLVLHLLAGRSRPERVDRVDTVLDFDATARLLDHIEARLHERLLVQELADLTYLSRAHFLRAFTRTVGTTPHRLIVGRRLDRAADLLRTTSWPVAEIAAATGWVSRSHFSRAFTGRFAQSAHDYRRSGSVETAG